MSRQRLDQELVRRGLATTRSQAQNLIKLSQVKVNGRVAVKPGSWVNPNDEVNLTSDEQYVSRAGLKLASVAEKLKLDFKDKVVLDIGSSTGGFTDYSLQHGAQKVIAVDVGTDQLHPSLRPDKRVELHEKTDIRNFTTHDHLDVILADVSFISLREILPTVKSLCSDQTRIAVMVKPQFEAGQSSLKHKGVIKNDRMRREILQDFEQWVKKDFIIDDKADSQVSGSKGNQERFYLLRKA